MIFVKGALAGVAALLLAALTVYALAVGEGGMRVYSIGPFPYGRSRSRRC